MCTFLIGTLPQTTNLQTLESAIPTQLTLRLLREGLRDASVTPGQFGFSPLHNEFLQRQLLGQDQLILLTRLHCDCWSTLGTGNTSCSEAQRWCRIFQVILFHVGRFGLIVHSGNPTDPFPLAGPIRYPLRSQDSLMGLLRDTHYEFFQD